MASYNAAADRIKARIQGSAEEARAFLREVGYYAIMNDDAASNNDSATSSSPSEDNQNHKAAD